MNDKPFAKPEPGTPAKRKIAIILFGVFLCLIMLEIGLRLGGFILSALQEAKNMASIGQNGAYRIMCLGESTTFGQYPGFLEEILNQRSKARKFSVIDKGMPGIDTTGIISGLQKNIETYRPDLVVAMMGINDDNEYLYHSEASDTKFTQFLKCFRIFKLGKLVLSPFLAKINEGRRYAPVNNIRYVNQDLIKLDAVYDYIGICRSYLAKGEYLMSEGVSKRILAIEPYNIDAIKLLVATYGMQGDEAASSLALRNGAANVLNEIKRSSGNQRTELIKDYYYMGADYLYRGNFDYAAEIFKTVLEIDPRCGEAYLGLANIAFFKNDYEEASIFLRKATEVYGESMAVYSMRAFLSYELKEYSIAEKYMKKASVLYSDPYAETAKQNYRVMKALLDKKGIRLVCVQYPMRRVKPLKEIFESGDDIIFVDNEMPFKRAVLKSGYKEYFVDIFGGDFGHCTDKGNRLLAENIADAILVRMPRNNAIRDAEAGYGQEK